MKARDIYLFHFGIRLACILPRPITVIIAKILVAFRFLWAKREKNIIKKNLYYCGIKSSSYNVFKTFINYGICLSDVFRAVIYSRTSFDKIVEFKGGENLTKALEMNRGAILVTAHIGNWDLAGVYLSSLGYPITAVSEEIPGLSDIFNSIRTKTGMEIVFMREKDKMVSALENNRVLALLGDRDLTKRGLKVKFLTGEKTVPRGTAAFALKYKTPVCFGYFVLNQDKKSKTVYKSEIYEPIIPGNETQEEFLQIIADRLSNLIRQFPTQWFVFWDEWENSKIYHRDTESQRTQRYRKQEARRKRHDSCF